MECQPGARQTGALRRLVADGLIRLDDGYILVRVEARLSERADGST
jgi:hypothetical protein